MKKSTVVNKLNELLGLAAVAEEVKKKEEIRQGNTQAVTEEEIQESREAQGIIYFLQAPELFQSRVCKLCGNSFVVSRLYVAYCSYYCIEASMREIGIEWRQGDWRVDIEKIIHEVYEGNEPIWVRQENLDRLYETLRALRTSRDVTEKTGVDLSTSSSESLANMLSGPPLTPEKTEPELPTFVTSSPSTKSTEPITTTGTTDSSSTSPDTTTTPIKLSSKKTLRFS